MFPIRSRIRLLCIDFVANRVARVGSAGALRLEPNTPYIQNLKPKA